MATSPTQFLRFLAENTSLLVDLFDRGEVDEAQLLSLIERYRSDTSPARDHLRRQIEEFGIIEPAAHADATYELSLPVVELLSWLTRRQRKSSATVLRAYLDDIGGAGRELDGAVESGDASAASLALGDLDSLVERVRQLSEGNREAVISEAQGLRSAAEGLSAVDRFTVVGRLWERHLTPLRHLVRIWGEMEQLLDRVRTTLDAGEQRFLAHGPVQRGFSKPLARLARFRRAAFADHRAAIHEVEPLYRRVRRDSRWMLGASRALAQVRTEGVAAVRLDERLGLVGWRTRYLMSDEKIRARMADLVGYTPPAAKPLAKPPPPPELPLVTRAQLADAVAASSPIEDVLAFVLQTWPTHPLTAQLRAFAQLTAGEFGALSVAVPPTPRRYAAHDTVLEAVPLSLPGGTT